MNFKKISVSSIASAILLFSCAGGKAEFDRNKMKSEINTNYSEQATKDKYAAGKQVEVAGTIEGEKIKKTFTLDGKIMEDDEGMHVIELKDQATPDESFAMLILDLTTLEKIPESAHFYKLNNGYSMSFPEGDMTNEVTFGKDFVSTSANGTIDGQTQSITFTYKG